MSNGLTIAELLRAEGSDKWKWYGEFYDFVLGCDREAIRSVVEVGIGTMLPDVPSSMIGYADPGYRPGGSLRAWRDYFPYAIIQGIDVQPDTQFSDQERIRTFICDSSNAVEFSTTVACQLRLPIDIAIDDGLHLPDHQIATLANLYPLVRAGGLYIIEDVIAGTVGTLMNAIAASSPAAQRVVVQSHHADSNPDCVALAIRKPV